MTGSDGKDYWDAQTKAEYWCADYATFVWRHDGGIPTPNYASTLAFAQWAYSHGRWSTDFSKLQPGDAVFWKRKQSANDPTPILVKDPTTYQGGNFDHVGLVVDVSGGNETESDGDFGGDSSAGSGTSQQNFANSSHVTEDTTPLPANMVMSSAIGAYPVGFAMADVGGNGAGAPIRNCYKTPSYCWGLDAFDAQTTNSLNSISGVYGANPDFFGRYLNNAGSGGPVPLRGNEMKTYSHNGIAVLLIADSFTQSSIQCASSNDCSAAASTGTKAADDAATAARNLGVPADGKIALFADVEAGTPVAGAFIKAYADETVKKGFRAGFYESQKAAFASAYCGAATGDDAVGKAALWSKSPNADGTYSKGRSTESGSPGYHPDVSSCAGSTVLWQYGEPGTDTTDTPASVKSGPNVDTDEVASDKVDVLYRP